MTADTPEKRTQAERIYARFGGVPQLHGAMAKAGVERNISSLYRWNLPKERGGSGGVVPATAMRDVVKAARHMGVLIGADDYRPETL